MEILSERKQRRIWMVVGVVTIIVLWLLHDVLFPFVAGMVLAYFLDPLVDRLERRRISRTWGTSIVLLGFLLLFTAFLLMLAPLIYDQTVTFAQNLPRYLSEINMRLMPKLEALRPRLGITGTYPMRSRKRCASAARQSSTGLANPWVRWWRVAWPSSTSLRHWC
jgi:predicted PurR-regulated permease PerM